MIGNGLVVDPLALLEEIEQLDAAGVDVANQLRISNRAHVLLPSHRLVEKISGDPGKVADRHYARAASARAMRTRRRGAGSAWPICWIAQYFPDALRAAGCRIIVTRARAFGIWTTRSMRRCRWRRYARGRGAHPADGLRHRRGCCTEAMAAGKNLLFEGAQGTMLDLDHGTLSVRDFLQRFGGRGLHRRGRAADEDRRRDRHLEGIHDARGRRPVSLRRRWMRWAI